MKDKCSVAHMRDFTTANPLSIQVNEIDLVGVLTEDTVSVFEGRCPHEGTLLAEGSLENGVLTCRAHGWQFDCLSGKRKGFPQTCLKQFTVAIENETINIDAAEVRAWKLQAPASMPSKQQTIRTLEDLPGPKGWPLVGNALQLDIKQLHVSLEKWHELYGPLYTIKIGPRPTLVIAEPELATEVLRNRPQLYRRLDTMETVIRELGIDGVFTAEGENWRRQRLLVMQALDTKHLRQFFPTLVKVTQRLKSHLAHAAQKREVVEVQKDLMRYTVDVTTNLAFGYDMNTLEQEEDPIQHHLEKIFPMLSKRIFAPFPYWRYLKLPADYVLDNALQEVRKCVEEFMTNTRANIANNPDLAEHPTNLLEAMLVAQDEEEQQFSNDEIYGNVFTMLLAGEDTTANTIAWMIYFMLDHPDVQSKMQEEADTILNGEELIVDFEQVRKFHYIDAVAHEAMRLKPVAPLLFFEANEDVDIGDLHVPKHTSIYLLNRPGVLQEQIFPQPTAFLPERWLSANREDASYRRKSFVPFGSGPRLCPGRSLALHEIRCAMAMLCRNFHVSKSDRPNQVSERFAFTMMPTDLFVQFSPRQA